MDECEKCTKNNTTANENVDRQGNHRVFQLSYASHCNFIVILIVLLLSSSFPLTLANSICKHHEYWDSNLKNCVPCTKCNPHQIIIRPCQRHLDTVCRPIDSVNINLNKNMLPIDRHHRITSTMKSLSAEEIASREEEMLIWNWQLITLILAIIACLLFFIVTIIIFINYVRQWRKIKKQFDTDIEQLSQQLMLRLAVPPSESSTIFIDDPSSRNSRFGKRQIEVRCVYLDDIIAGKESIKESKTMKPSPIKNMPTGNVYIEE